MPGEEHRPADCELRDSQARGRQLHGDRGTAAGMPGNLPGCMVIQLSFRSSDPQARCAPALPPPSSRLRPAADLGPVAEPLTVRPLQSWTSRDAPEGRFIFHTTVTSGPSSARR